jgi:predicted nucleic acid-binding protein
MTMTSRALDIRSHNFQGDDRLLIDANVWLRVYGPLAPGGSYSAIYSKAHRKMRMANCTLFIDVVVLSEFINAFARLEFQQGPQAALGFKTFRKSEAFGLIAREIAINAKRIVTQCQCVESGFEDIDVSTLLTDFQSGQHDFNDQVIAELCLARRLKLVTHDADFQKYGLTVLTANGDLLNACQS